MSADLEELASIMGSTRKNSLASRAAPAFDSLPTLSAAVLVTQVLSARVLSGLPIRPTQWETLSHRVHEWRAWLSIEESRNDARTRSHLNVLTKLLGAILEQHRTGEDVGADVWRELQPFVHAADEYLQTFPMPRRKASTRYPACIPPYSHPAAA
jgi:hypothetical protein